MTFFLICILEFKIILYFLLFQEDTEMTLRITAAYRMGGIILWGKGENVNDSKKCGNVYEYMTSNFGPALESVRKDIQKPEFFEEILK